MEQIYDSRHSGQEVDKAVDAVQTTIPNQLTQIGSKVDKLEQEVIYDVSANNDGVTFASLSALLSSENLSTLIPVAVRCGGMSIRFVQTSDNKYVQYRLMANQWSTTVTDWQGVDDEPIPDSTNLVTSGGISTHSNALDISVLNNGVSYENLALALAAVPANLQKTGMSIKYINSVTGKYVYYNYNNTNGNFADISNWQQIGINTYIKSLLQEILYNAVYTTDVNSLIDELGNALSGLDNGEQALKTLPPIISISDGLISIVGTNEIYYTIDGRTPDKNSIRYTSPFLLQYDSVVKAVAYNGDAASAVTALHYSAEPVEFITFEDTEVLEPLVLSLYDMDNDGKLSAGEAAAVASIGTNFANKAITSFEELAFFTGLTALGLKAFKDCTSLKRVRVPKGVTKIDNQAFDGCSNLEMVYLPDTITTMCSCFGGSSGTTLSKLKIAGNKLPPNLSSFSGAAANDLRFKGCAELELDELPAHFPKISSFAFCGCSKLALTSLPNEIESIGDHAFTGCTKLAITEIPASVSGSISTAAFAGCSSLVSLDIKGSITSLGGTSFQDCSNLEEIIFPETMTDWSGAFTFLSCDKLTKIVLKSPTVVTLNRANNETIGKNSIIYVPSNLVASYLADAKWSTITNASNRIKPIEE